MTSTAGPSSAPWPTDCRVALKEWSGVCQALVSGRQVILLRKGGVAEEAGRFLPEHPAFWLYPTHVHEQQQGLKDERPSVAPAGLPPDKVVLPGLAVVTGLAFVDRLEAIEALGDLHVWTDETVRKRFAYRSPGLWVLALRVAAGRDMPRMTIGLDHAGCKSWVPLDEPIRTTGLAPVLDDAEFARRLEPLQPMLQEFSTASA